MVKSIPATGHLQSSFLTGLSPAGLPFTLMAWVSASHLLKESVTTCRHILMHKRSVFQVELWERITTQPMMIPHLTLGFMGFQATLLFGFYFCTCYHGECLLSHLTKIGDNHVSSPRSPGEYTPNPIFTLHCVGMWQCCAISAPWI